MSFDEGLQPERTALAWRRTGLVAAAAAMALGRTALARGLGALAILCLLIVVAAASTLAQGTGQLRPRTPRSTPALSSPVLPLAAHATVAVTVLLAVVGLALVVAS